MYVKYIWHDFFFFSFKHTHKDESEPFPYKSSHDGWIGLRLSKILFVE